MNLKKKIQEGPAATPAPPGIIFTFQIIYYLDKNNHKFVRAAITNSLNQGVLK